MGIPSFFSYIIKQHNRNVIYRNIQNVEFGYLLIDANSLIYDVYNRLLKESNKSTDIETVIIDEVGIALEKLINHINPTIKTFIAFDGVCPFAKMKHQRNRRLKSFVLKELPTTTSTPPFTWDTINITPGTPFMQRLTQSLKGVFEGDNKVLFSGADMIGEGETKICHYIRDCYANSSCGGGGGNKGNNGNKLPKMAFYGLDNDIIMLSILHLYCTENIYVFREEPPKPPNRKSPHNVSTNNNNNNNIKKENEFIYINIKSLCDSVLYEMDCIDRDFSRVIDYVFLCFFLGNDFMPKFPAIQIRTRGITFLLDTYREHIGKYSSRRLINYGPTNGPTNRQRGGRTNGQHNFVKKGGIINWGWVGHFISKLAINEHQFIIMETEERDNMEASLRMDPLNAENHENMPMLYRQDEHYIAPNEPGWEWRYYKALFDKPPTPQLQKDWCCNYLEGLEWTMRYYTGDCPNWRWVYRNEYSPLLQDLTMWIPRAYNWEFFPPSSYRHNPYNTDEQLAFVMPPVDLDGDEKRAFSRSAKWKWAYCRYLWESHISVGETA